MQKRKFDELISHFNRKVSDMSIDQKYKMELLGMISAIGFAHEKELGTNLAEVGMDCISRQAAINALDCINGVEEVLRSLPSANPEPCEDAVNRETILKFFDGWMSALDENCHNQSVSDLKIIKRDFANLPPVMPKQRTGKWIKKHRHYGGFRSYTGFDAMGEQHTITVDERTEYDDLYCSECGARSADNFLNFCPNCGAKMEETT